MPPTWMLITAGIVTFFAGLAQGTVGFGAAVLAVPVLTLIDPRLTPIPQILIAIPLTGAMLMRERTGLDLRGSAWVLLGRVPGALVGLALLSLASERSLSVFIGGMVLVLVVAIRRGVRLRQTRPVQFAVGVASGTSGMAAGIGGPPVALLYRDAPGNTIRSTLSAIFLVGLIINVTTLGIAGSITGVDARIAGWLVGPLLVGLLASGPLRHRVEGAFLKNAILLLAGVAAAGLIVSAAL